MRQRRLDRLARLTQGAALLSLTALTACHDDGAGSPEPIHTNSPYVPTGDAGANAIPTATASTTDATASATTSAASSSTRTPIPANATAAPPKVTVPLHTNAPPEVKLPKPTAPMYTNSPPSQDSK